MQEAAEERSSRYHRPLPGLGSEIGVLLLYRKKFTSYNTFQPPLVLSYSTVQYSSTKQQQQRR